MLQVAYPVESTVTPEFLNPILIGSAFAVSGTISTIIGGKELREEKPVEIVDGMIEINENMIKENQIQSVEFNNQTYYVRKRDGAIEIFQLEE